MLHPPIAAVTPVPAAAPLPSRDLLKKVLASHIIEIPAGQVLVRAAWNPPSIWPHRVTRTYRFGPPISLNAADGFPFYWIYAADQTHTAVWEAQFCGNPATLPGRFIVTAGAEDGLIASLSFGQSLRLYDLSGVAASKLGIYDELRSPDYAWCQQLGLELDQILAEHNGEVHGFVYPSRRHPGAMAYAISSRVRHLLAAGMTVDAQRFADTSQYAELLADPCHIGCDGL